VQLLRDALDKSDSCGGLDQFELDEFAALVLAGSLWSRFGVEIPPEELMGSIDVEVLRARVAGLAVAESLGDLDLE